MKNITIEIHDDKTMVVVPVPVVEGENLTTQIVVTAPPSWDGYLIRCLMTTPRSKMVDPFDVTSSIDLTNSMLDGPGSLKVEFIGTKNGVEVVRTRQAVSIPVYAARKPLGTISPEPLPDLLAEMVDAKNGCNTAAQSCDEVKTETKNAEALRVTAEQSRASAEQGRYSSYQNAESARNGAYTIAEIARNSTFNTAENGRALAESSRVTSEQGRAAAEVIREQKITDIEALISDVDSAMEALESSLVTILGEI